MGFLPFDPRVPAHVQKIVEDGWKSFYYRFQTQDQSNVSTKLRARLDYTDMFLKHVSDNNPVAIARITGLESFWREKGQPEIANALAVRLKEAELPDIPEPEEPEEALYEEPEVFYEDEEAPLTMRSVAKAIRFATIYYKLVRG